MNTTLYNRSEILSFYDLSKSQKESVLIDMDEQCAIEDSFVIFDGKKHKDVLALSMFQLIKSKLWDGVYGTSYFSAYLIKISKCGTMAVVAEKYQ